MKNAFVHPILKLMMIVVSVAVGLTVGGFSLPTLQAQPTNATTTDFHIPSLISQQGGHLISQGSESAIKEICNNQLCEFSIKSLNEVNIASEIRKIDTFGKDVALSLHSVVSAFDDVLGMEPGNTNDMDTGTTLDNALPVTCYCYEGTCPLSSEDDDPFDIDLDTSQPDSNHHVRTDCSGWVSYALSQTNETAYSEISALEGNMQWPQAYHYYNYFSNLTSNDTSDSWDAYEDLANLKAGDVLVWCLADKCPNGQGSAADTGHIMIVIAKPLSLATPASTVTPIISAIHEQNPATSNLHTISDLMDSDTNLQFWQIPVIDSSSVPHGSSNLNSDEGIFQTSSGNSLAVFDNRDYSSFPPDSEAKQKCTAAGGFGSGIIVLAQWRYQGQWYWGWNFHDGKDSFYTGKRYQSLESFQVVFGRL